ncbi:hypothetical protein GCM10025857_22610 [Alicyclobacillus contaminans]|nr:hypothetical protein GCM10025857_22610 [Alicyclobacillus contaminans]
MYPNVMESPSATNVCFPVGSAGRDRLSLVCPALAAADVAVLAELPDGVATRLDTAFADELCTRTFWESVSG